MALKHFVQVPAYQCTLYSVHDDLVHFTVQCTPLLKGQYSTLAIYLRTPTRVGGGKRYNSKKRRQLQQYCGHLPEDPHQEVVCGNRSNSKKRRQMRQYFGHLPEDPHQEVVEDVRGEEETVDGPTVPMSKCLNNKLYYTYFFLVL